MRSNPGRDRKLGPIAYQQDMMMMNRLSLICALAATVALPAQEAAKKSAAEASSAVSSEVSAKTAVKLIRLRGSYADLPEAGMSFTGLLGGGTKPKAFFGLMDRLAELAADEETSLVLFDLSEPVGLNLAQLRELERGLAALRKAKKKCYAYLENADSVRYQIASQCDEVSMADMGAVDLSSLALSVTFFKDALDLLGVHMDIVRCGDFKGAVEPYMRSEMSKHLRAQYQAMLFEMNADVVRRIAQGRGIEEKAVRRLQEQRLLSAGEALRAGLVDRLVPWQGARRAMERTLGREDFELEDLLSKRRRSFNPMALLAELFQPPRKKKLKDETIVVLHLSGEIVDGKKAAAGSIVSGPAVELIEDLATNARIKGVVVRINSPGGSATASEAILLALSHLAKTKPVVCSMGSLAASGGYYITCFGRPILAEPGTITGSIGVFGMKPNLGPLMRRIGIRQELITLDEGAAMSAIDRGWSESQKARVQGHVNEVYDRFVGHVSSSRKMSRKRVLQIGGGRVWSGVQAVQNGLVDRIGGLQDALALVRREAHLDAEIKVTHLPRPLSPFAAMAEAFAESRILSRSEARLLERVGGLRPALTIMRAAFRDPPVGRVWALLPLSIQLR